MIFFFGRAKRNSMLHVILDVVVTLCNYSRSVVTALNLAGALAAGANNDCGHAVGAGRGRILEIVASHQHPISTGQKNTERRLLREEVSRCIHTTGLGHCGQS